MLHKKLFALVIGIACITPAMSLCMEKARGSAWDSDSEEEAPLETKSSPGIGSRVTQRAGDAIKEMLRENRADLEQKGFGFDHSLLDMSFDDPMVIIPALSKFYMIQPDTQNRIPLFTLIKDGGIKSSIADGLKQLPLEILECFEFLAKKGCSFLSALPKGAAPQEATDIADAIYDTFHQAADSQRTFFGQFARLTLGGKITVGIGTVFAGLGIVKTIEWFQDTKQPEDDLETRYAY
jgi:hypothetical protein